MLLATIVAWPAQGGEVARAGEPRRPNILLIITDDQRADGASLAVMPKTRRWLQRGGRRFTNAFVTTPNCCPSRASIFTGLYTHNHGLKHSADREPMPPRSSTVQWRLRRGGYRTGYFGKFLNGWNLRKNPPDFHRWAIISKAKTAYRRGPWNVQGRVRYVRRYSTSFLRRKAVRFLNQGERRDRKPWFMVVAPVQPHTPATPQRKYRRARVPRFRHTPATREADRSDKPPFFRNRNMSLHRIKRIRRAQLRSLRSVDDLVHALFKRMRRLGERRNTLVIFISDNGYLWGEHGRGRKLYPYTMSIKVPLLMRWPGHVRRGRDGRIAANVDIAPTILHAARFPQGRPMDGRTLLRRGERDRILTEYWKAAYAPDWASIRTREYQYTEYYDGAGEVIFREYYDMRADRWQLRNLLGDADPANDPSDVAALSAQLALDRECEGTEGPTACP